MQISYATLPAGCTTWRNQNFARPLAAALLAASLVLAMPALAAAQQASEAAEPAAKAGQPTEAKPADKPTLVPISQLSPEQQLQLRKTPISRVVEAAGDSVVNISSTRIVQARTQFGGIATPFDQLFEFPSQRRQLKATSVGSGFVIHRDGYIVTNAHVVARTADRHVNFATGDKFDAEIVAIDPEHDLAILKIETDKPLKPLPLGTSSDLMVGETAIAIGNPLGYSHSVTTGIVSALNRDLEANEEVTFTGLIQTDASINPGNSGGPLLNILGQLIGINTAIRADAQNIGFAIPVDQLRKLLPELLDVERRYHLVTGIEISPTGPARVTAVADNSPASLIGLQPGDVIVKLGDATITNAIDFNIALIGRSPGERVELELMRDNKPGKGTLTLTERPRPDGKMLIKKYVGLTVVPLTEEAAKRAQLPGLTGLVIESVDAGSPADQVGIRRGDVLVQVGRFQPRTLEDVGQLLEKVKSGQAIDLAILRVTRNIVYRSTVRIKAQ